MTTVLWHLELSHYNEKVRWALDFKSINYELRSPIPGLHGLRALALTRGAQRRLPVIELDGERIGDSTAIIAALERRTPEPPLYPRTPAARVVALELEDFFDEHLAPDVRSFVWHYTLQDTDAVIASLFAVPNPTRERLLRATAPLARPIIQRDYRTSARDANISRAKILTAMDLIEETIQPSGYLVGDAFSVADLAAAALFTPLLHPPGRPYMPASVAPEVQHLRDEFSARPGGDYINTMYTLHRHPGRASAPAAA